MSERSRSADETHAAILDAAVQIMATEGIAAVTFRAIATRVGVTPMALYHHIADKEALIVEVIERGYVVFADHLDRATGDEPGVRLERTIEGFRDFGLDHGHYFELMFLSRQLRPDMIDDPSLRRVMAPTYRTLCERVAERIGTAPDDSRAADASRFLLTAAIGAIALHRTSLFTTTREQGAEQFDHQMRRALDVVLRDG